MLREFDQTAAEEIGLKMYRFAEELYPICRSITGDGVRRTLAMIQHLIPLQIIEVPTGTHVFDWEVPKEWNIRDAFIKTRNGKRVVDFQKCNLHVVNYSVPVHATMPLSELKPHLFTIPDRPEWIPYRTTYYKEDWGFCLSHNQLSALEEREYEVCIDSTLEEGHLTYGEYYLPGRSTDEVLISCHICHPSLANDNLSAVAIATFLAKALSAQERFYSFRILYLPGTIGAITWLSANGVVIGHIRHGIVLTCLGDLGRIRYKKSRRGNTEIDRVSEYVLRQQLDAPEILEFFPYGSDERQYCSPGFNLPVGCLMRTVRENCPEYHTSADNLDFVHPHRLAESYHVCASILEVLEKNRRYRNLSPFCEPQLGRRGLYSSAGDGLIGQDINARLWVLSLSDGEHSILDIAEKSGIPFLTLSKAADLLCQNGLLSVVPNDSNEASPDELAPADSWSRF